MSSWAGNLIKLARLKTGLSQRELAARAGTSQPTIAAYESARKSPGLDTLARIIRAAGLDLRIALAPYDDHDEWLARFEAGLPPEVVARARKQREELRAAAAARRRARQTTGA